MKTKTRLIIVASDGYPLEQIIGKWYFPLINFIRRRLHGKYKQCKVCYEKESGVKVAGENNHLL